MLTIQQIEGFYDSKSNTLEFDNSVTPNINGQGDFDLIQGIYQELKRQGNPVKVLSFEGLAISDDNMTKLLKIFDYSEIEQILLPVVEEHAVGFLSGEIRNLETLKLNTLTLGFGKLNNYALKNLVSTFSYITHIGLAYDTEDKSNAESDFTIMTQGIAKSESIKNIKLSFTGSPDQMLKQLFNDLGDKKIDSLIFNNTNITISTFNLLSNAQIKWLACPTLTFTEEVIESKDEQIVLPNSLETFSVNSDLLPHLSCALTKANIKDLDIMYYINENDNSKNLPIISEIVEQMPKVGIFKLLVFGNSREFKDSLTISTASIFQIKKEFDFSLYLSDIELSKDEIAAFARYYMDSDLSFRFLSDSHNNILIECIEESTVNKDVKERAKYKSQAINFDSNVEAYNSLKIAINNYKVKALEELNIESLNSEWFQHPLNIVAQYIIRSDISSLGDNLDHNEMISKADDQVL